MRYRLYIDDEWTPNLEEFDFIARSYLEAVEMMAMYGCPSYVSFDHDLGGDHTGYDIARTMIEIDMESGGRFIPKDFEFNVHSANPVGAENIRSLLNNYLQQRG